MKKTVMIESRYLVRGLFNGKYFALLQNEPEMKFSEFFGMRVYEAELMIDAVKPVGEGDLPGTAVAGLFKPELLNEVKCCYPPAGQWFKVNFQNAGIAEPVLSLVTPDGTQRYGVVTGIFYGYLSEWGMQYIPEPDQPVAIPAKDLSYPWGAENITADYGNNKPSVVNGDDRRIKLELPGYSLLLPACLALCRPETVVLGIIFLLVIFYKALRASPKHAFAVIWLLLLRIAWIFLLTDLFGNKLLFYWWILVMVLRAIE